MSGEVIRTVAGTCRFQREIKKSRFEAKAVRVQDASEAVQAIKALSVEGASHNAWAFKIGDLKRFSDDGEPGGTAGKPILIAIDGQGLDQVLVVVSRHFGGIKLGSGGLVRAYGGTASECLGDAKRIVLRPRVLLRVSFSFSQTSSFYQLLETFDADKKAEEFSQRGPLVSLEIFAEDLPNFLSQLKELSAGQLEYSVEELPYG